MAVCILLAGSSRQHALRLAFVELAALPVLGLGILILLRPGFLDRHLLALGIAAATVAIPLLQLIPLPPGLWASLPGREVYAESLAAAGVTAGWAAASLTPDLTWYSALALLPPLAVFLTTMGGDRQAMRWSTYALLLVTGVAVALGVAQGAVSYDWLYPWSITDRGQIAGLFANRNHLATLCLVAIPFSAALAAGGVRRGQEGRAASWIGGLVLVLCLVAIAAIRSRAGVILVGPVLGLSGLVAWIAADRVRLTLPLIAGAGSAAAVVTAVAIFGLAPIMARFDASAATEGRFDRWPLVAQTAQAYLPVGAGMGSFDRVYRSVEPLEEVDETFFNRAHNDYLEIWLEAGWFGVAALMAFFIWFGRRTWAAWRAGPGAGPDLRRAASVAVMAVLAHSFADFPLRTVAIAAALAFCLGLLENTGLGSKAERRVS